MSDPSGTSPRRHLSRRGFLAAGTSVLALSACGGLVIPAAPPPVGRGVLDGLPYHPMPFHLDLCILSYQLYAQTLVWPFDPYYERHRNNAARKSVMDRVRAWAATPQANTNGPPVGGYRGPGVLNGFPDNPLHDPILFRYDMIRPWARALTLANIRWTEQLPQRAITDQIAQVDMCYRPAGSGTNTTTIQTVARAGRFAAPGARDHLIAFEGETGDKGERGQPGSQSMMGFVLKRFVLGTEEYDIHIVFRGSRSGEVLRTAFAAFSESQAEGNPDWITDLGFNLVGPAQGAAAVSSVGRVHRGMARSIQSMFPKITAVLARLATPGRSPRHITTTGHSLGGGLALHFASAVLSGNRLGPRGQGPLMPFALKGWPWTRMKLVTYGAPVVGDEDWAQHMARAIFDVPFTSDTAIGTTFTDPAAIPVNLPRIAERLADRTRPAAFRVSHPKDPITTTRIIRGSHVGEAVYVASVDRLGLGSPDAHEPAVSRTDILNALDDPSVPRGNWTYRDLRDISPASDPDRTHRAEDFDTLLQAILGYFRGPLGQENRTRLQQDYRLFQTIP